VVQEGLVEMDFVVGTSSSVEHPAVDDARQARTRAVRAEQHAVAAEERAHDLETKARDAHQRQVDRAGAARTGRFRVVGGSADSTA
jgi:hypothetical protein